MIDSRRSLGNRPADCSSRIIKNELKSDSVFFDVAPLLLAHDQVWGEVHEQQFWGKIRRGPDDELGSFPESSHTLLRAINAFLLCLITLTFSSFSSRLRLCLHARRIMAADTEWTGERGRVRGIRAPAEAAAVTVTSAEAYAFGLIKLYSSAAARSYIVEAR